MSTAIKKGSKSTRVAVAAAATAVAAGWAGASTASATTYVWNNTGTTWESATAYTPNAPAGGPTSADVASFDPTVAAAGTAVMNPTINASNDSAGTLSLDNSYLGGNYVFTGTGTLAVGNAAGTSNGSFGATTFNVPTGVVARGFGTTTFNGPTLAGATAGSLTFNVGSGSGVTLAGNTTASTNAGSLLLSGTLTLDNTGTAAVLNRLSTTSNVALNGGTLSVLSGAAGGTVNVGTLDAATGNQSEGVNTISLTVPTGTTPAVLNFANTGAFSLRATTGLVDNFVAVGGVLGSAGGPQVTFTGTPNTSTYAVGGNGGLISNNTTTTVGFATVTDANGTNFATYVAPTAGAAGGITAITPSATGVTAADLIGFTNNGVAGGATVAQFNPAAGSTITTTTGTNTTGNVSAGSLRITPAGAGVTIAMGAGNLNTNALMLDGANDLTISATPTLNASGGATSGLFGSGGTRYLYVDNPAATLTTSLVIANGTNPTNIVGPGIVALNGTSAQNQAGVGTTSTNTRLNLIGGTLRGNATQVGFNSSGGGQLSFRGGVLEVTGGTDGTGAAADFTRPVSATNTAGYVNWSSTATGDAVGGSGGFSAFGAPASVNIGGAATPSTLTWGVPGSGFVQDGEQLIFGSAKSNARLDFLNPVALDGGTAGAYDARTVQVIGGAGGDNTNLAGAITGSATTDLVKTGTGKLVLTGANTYAGRTFVEGGTLVNNSSTGTGTVTVTSGVLAGTGMSAAVVLPAGGTLSTGSGATATDSIGTLNVGALNAAGGVYVAKVGGGTSDRLMLSGLTFAGTSAGQLTINPVIAATATATTYVIADDTASATAFVAPLAARQITLTTAAAAAGDTLTFGGDGGTGEDLILNVVAAPEPTSLLLVAAAAAPLVLGRRRRAASAV